MQSLSSVKKSDRSSSHSVNFINQIDLCGGNKEEISRVFFFGSNYINVLPVHLHVEKLLKFNPFPNDKFYAHLNSKALQTTILNLMKMMKNAPNG